MAAYGTFSPDGSKLAYNRRSQAYWRKGYRGSSQSDVTILDLRDYAMPIYDGDDEAASGLPENAVKLKLVFMTHCVVFIASP